jgi:hypothetical protein
MRKKRLTKSEKATLDKISGLQLTALMMLKERVEVLIKAAEATLATINDKGMNNHYSKHSDILRYAQEVWSASHRLGELKALVDDMEYAYGEKK